jgi:hypothetical protein
MDLSKILKMAMTARNIDWHRFSPEQAQILQEARKIIDRIINLIEFDETKDPHLRSRYLFMENKRLGEVLQKWNVVKDQVAEGFFSFSDSGSFSRSYSRACVSASEMPVSEMLHCIMEGDNNPVEEVAAVEQPVAGTAFFPPASTWIANENQMLRIRPYKRIINE